MNASEERGIDTIRNRIIEFCSSVSLDQGKEKLKCVILDEIDGATAEYFSALRGVIERYANTTRFITSCNYIQKIPDAIQSRFHKISFDPISSEEEEYLIKEYKERVKLILNAIKISYTDDILSKFVLNDFPDLRAIINKLQSLYLRGAKQLDLILDFDFEELFKLCLAKPDPVNNYKFISEQYSNKIDESLVSLGRDFIKYLKEKAPNKVDKIPLIIITMAEYQYQKQFVIDPIITLLAACMKIQQILNE
jgi:DNA polymerase III delta prime subunit